MNAQKVDKKELEACKLWVQRAFSNIPTALLEKAYFSDGRYGEEIAILAPSFEDFKKQYYEENCKGERECENC